MSQGKVTSVETTGYKPLVLCASGDGNLDTYPTHALRRLEMRAIAWGENSDHVVTACGERLGRPCAIFFAPLDEINCPECFTRVAMTRKDS